MMMERVRGVESVEVAVADASTSDGQLILV